MPETKKDSTTEPTSNGASPPGDDKMLNRIIKRFGGRHLIFRTQLGSWRLFPRPYALVSTFRGPVWFFYGVGQVWVTHKKYVAFDGWMSRVPRISRPKIVTLLDELNQPITEFTHYCNENGLEGTIVMDRNTIEFHWTFGYELEKEKMKTEQTQLLDEPFKKLVDAFLVAKKATEA
ncbi:MAG: hypothetical protein AB8B55_21660 [Mariniblastus sp.]